VIKLITAVASVTTFIMLMPMMPTLVALPSPSELAGVNQKLATEIEERRAAEDQVRRINEELEDRVAKRTAERHALEDQLIQSQKMEAVGRLAGGVAHDFNNLVTVIVGYNDMVREQSLHDPELQEFSEEIHRAAERATALTNQLLAFSRRQVAMPRIVDLNDVVRDMDKLLRRLIGEDIELKIRMGQDLRHVRIDPAHMDQVIMNLAINSRDAMPLGGKLTIETAEIELSADRQVEAPAGRYVMLTVGDTGVGMDAVTCSRVFEPFFTTKEKGKGTGLGLSIAYGIVKQNGGQILVSSEPGYGTTFKIYLPAIDAEVEPLIGEGDVRSVAAGGETILLAEDEGQVRSLARMILARRGYRVLEASSPDEALQLAREHGEIDLLLTDIVMPGMSGPDLAREITARQPGIRVLYMSGYADDNVMRHDILNAQAAFLQKPFTASSLHRKVREALGA
jgi:signal transduction histidine kinase/CheY-like chemotaxis protein